MDYRTYYRKVTFMDYEGVINLSATCKYFNSICNEFDSYWESECIRLDINIQGTLRNPFKTRNISPYKALILASDRRVLLAQKLYDLLYREYCKLQVNPSNPEVSLPSSVMDQAFNLIRRGTFPQSNHLTPERR